MADPPRRLRRAHGLMYHDVVGGAGSAATMVGPSLYNLPWSLFVEHLDRFVEEVSTPPTLIEKVGERKADEPHWSLTFDDGGASALEVGEELCRRGWSGYFFITTDRIGRNGFLSRTGIRELDAMGHVIGSHTVTHPLRIGSLPLPELRREWAVSVDELAALLDKPIRTASVPGGYYSKNVAITAAEAGIETLFTSQPVRTTKAVGSCLVIGRYIVRSSTSATAAAQAAAGDLRPWLRHCVGWNTRKAAKFVAGERYDRLRRRFVAGKQSL